MGCTMVRGEIRRERLFEFAFQVRLIEEARAFSGAAVSTFRRGKFSARKRGTIADFRRYREEMERNGFELVDVHQALVKRNGA